MDTLEQSQMEHCFIMFIYVHMPFHWSVSQFMSHISQLRIVVSVVRDCTHFFK